MENKTVGVNKMIKAIFFDIDGTLVSFKTHQVPDSTIEALKQLKKKGIIDDSFGIHLIYTDKHALMMISSETYFVNEVIKAIDKGVKQISITEEEVERMKKVLLSSQIYMSDNIYRMNNKIMRDMIDDGELNDHRTEEIKALNIDDMKKVLEALNFEHRTVNVIQVPTKNKNK